MIGLPSTLAQLTDRAFLDVLVRDGASSRAAVSRATGISKPTISDAAQRLSAAGVVVEVGPSVTGRRGRTAVLYDIDPRYGHVVGVVLERGFVGVRGIDFRGGVVAEAYSDRDEDLPAAAATARRLVAGVCRAAGSPLLAAAVSVAAPVDPRTRAVRVLAGAPFPGAVADLPAALGLSAAPAVDVDNDVNWATVAENRVGSMRGVDDFLYVHLGAGVGGGLFLSGRLHRGTGGMAGEIGFLRAGGATMLARVGSSAVGGRGGASIDVPRAVAAIEAGGPVAGDLLDVFASAIAAAVTTLDPGRVVVGGPLAAAAGLCDALADRIATLSPAAVTVTRSTVVGSAPLAGAALGALEWARAGRNSGG